MSTAIEAIALALHEPDKMPWERCYEPYKQQRLKQAQAAYDAARPFVVREILREMKVWWKRKIYAREFSEGLKEFARDLGYGDISETERQ